MEQLLQQATDFFETEGMPMLMNLVGALIILIVGFVAAKWARSGVNKALGRAKNIDTTLKPILASVVYYTIIVLVLAAVLTKVGVETASILAALGAAGLAIGLALQGTLSNIAAGVMLLWLRPLKMGEAIDAGGVTGTIEDVGLFVTRMKRPDGVFVSVPNAQLWNTPITNFTRNTTRRVDVVVGVSYNDDVDGALALLKALQQKDSRILKDPAPETMITALADNSVNITLRCWVATADFWPVSFDLNRDAKKELEAAGYSIPFPQRDIHVHHHGQAAAE